MYEILRNSNVNLTLEQTVSLGTPTRAHLSPFIGIQLLNRDCNMGGVTFSVGTNAPNYDDVVKDEQIHHSDLGINSTKFYPVSRKIFANQELFLNIKKCDIAGGSPPIFTAAVSLVGYRPGIGRNETIVQGSYTGGNIALGTDTDTDFEDIDATNAAISIPILQAGKWRVEFNFVLDVLSTAGVALNTQTLFRLQDEVPNNGVAIQEGQKNTTQVAVTTGFTRSVKVVHVFDFDSAGTKVVKLQKKNTVASGVNTRQVLATSDVPLVMNAYRISD